MNEQHTYTLDHIIEVQRLLNFIQIELNNRSANHDKSKLSSPEVDVFDKHSPELKSIEYGTDEYWQSLKAMEKAINHHHQNNRHHPQMHKDGISGMNLIDILEMVCDWKASTIRYKNGDIYKSLRIHEKRFGISKQLIDIIKNTVDWLHQGTNPSA